MFHFTCSRWGGNGVFWSKIFPCQVPRRRMLNEWKTCYILSPFQGSVDVGNNNSGKINFFCILDSRLFYFGSLSIWGVPWLGFAVFWAGGECRVTLSFVWSWEWREMGQRSSCAPVWTPALQLSPGNEARLENSLPAALSSLPVLAVNPKKDSENTPVKGGTVADLGKAPAPLPRHHPPGLKEDFKYF